MKAITFASTDVPRTGVAPDESGTFVPVFVLEGAATNILTDAEASTAWTVTRALATPNAGIAPDATTSATKLTGSTDNNTHHIKHAFASTKGDTVTFAPYVKAAELGWCKVTIQNKAGGSDAGAYFNLATGAIGTQDTTSIVSARVNTDLLADRGYIRPSITRGMSSGATVPGAFILLATSDGGGTFSGSSTAGIFVDMLHAEKRLFATSYIKTVGTALSRGADKTGLPFPHRPQMMTVYVKFIERMRGITSSTRLLTLGKLDGAGTSLLLITSRSDGRYKVQHNDATNTFQSVQSSSLPQATFGDTVEVVAQFDPDTETMQLFQSVNAGTAIGTGTGATGPVGPTFNNNELWMTFDNVSAVNGFADIIDVKVVSGLRSISEMRTLP